MNPWMYIGAAASLVVLAVMFVPLERAWAARRQPVLRREVALDVMFFVGQYVWWNAVSLAVLIHLHRAWRHLAPFACNTWPTWLQLIVALVLGELATYWLHRAFHRFDFLWRIHAVHHSSPHLDWIAGHREHPLDGMLIQLSMNLPAILLGFSLAAFGTLILFRGLWAIVVHSNTSLPLGPLRWILGAKYRTGFMPRINARRVPPPTMRKQRSTCPVRPTCGQRQLDWSPLQSPATSRPPF